MALLQEYAYRAVDGTGGAIVKGTLEAVSENAVVSKLRVQGLTPVSVMAVSKTEIGRAHV